MQCPYNKLELRLALVSITGKAKAYNKEHGEGSFEKLVDKVPTPDGSKPAVAAFHGITVEQLINSSNYDKLNDEFQNHLFKSALNAVKAAYDFDDVEAWASLMAATGNLI